MRTSNLLQLSLLIVATLSSLGASAQQARVDHYHLQLNPDIQIRSISGQLNLIIAAPTTDYDVLVLSVGDLFIDSVAIVTDRSIAPEFTTQDGQLVIDLSSLPSAEQTELEISYHGSPTFGLRFGGIGQEISTAFSTEQWMPVQVEPSLRATFSLDLVVPEKFTVVATGTHLNSETIDDGRVIQRWHEEEPMPAYLFGFVAGVFTQAKDDSASPTLRYLGPPNFSEQQLATIFADTRDALSFFENVSGIAYPDPEYAQVLLPNGYGQELNGMAVLDDSYGTAVLEDSNAIWLAIHEIAHQWWGNRVTNAEWTHFWLNEGIVSFLTAAYFEQRYGREAYDKLIGESRRQYELLINSSVDKPLVFPDWDSPTRSDRMVVYEKGAYVMHLLREQLGDELFWTGLKEYTQRHWQNSVYSEDLQRAMEDATGTDLGSFFAKWVYN